MSGIVEIFPPIVFIPVIVMISYTIISRRVIEPIVFSTVLAYVFCYGFGFFPELLQGLYFVIQGDSFSFIIVMLLCFGAVIHLIKETHGITALKRFMEVRIGSKRLSLFITWLLGLSLFMDDYLNSLIVGTTMKNITDRFKIPREKVSLVAITTGVPICILVPISTWAVFLYGVLQSNSIAGGEGLIPTHLKIVPFAVYPFVSIAGTLLLIFGMLPKLFYLKKAYERTESLSLVIPEENLPGAKENNEEEGRILNFLIPVMTLIIAAVLTSDVVMGALISLASTLVWLKLSKQLTISQFVDISIEGMQELLNPLVFMLFAFAFGHVLMEMNFANVVIDALSPYLVGQVIPLLCFWIVALIVFGGVDVWAVMPLVIPVFVPLGQAFDINIYLTIGAVLSGISFGTQMCFISESHILISETLDLKPIQQVLALMPYGIIYALVSSIIYLILGFYSQMK